MSRASLFAALIFLCCHARNDDKPISTPANSNHSDSLSIVGDIAAPPGSGRIPMAVNSFGTWLRNIHLKKDRHVYLYNGQLKRNQNAQFVVLDIPVGHKDLQQCADALMRLRAEFLFSQKRFSEIEFSDNNGKIYKWDGGANRIAFESYLEKIFEYCGSASLEKQLHPVLSVNDMQPGDVLIRGGFPGHAMMVMDVAINSKGKKMYLLAQSYMPAQDIHIVINPSDQDLSPWYELNDQPEIITPEWVFLKKQLRRW
jgi:hypothetical protein